MSREADGNLDDELDWARTVLGGDGRGPAQRYLCRPDRSRPELLIPLRPRAVAAGALHRSHDDRSPKDRLMVGAGRILGRTGALDRAAGDRLELAPFALVERLAIALGEPSLVAAVSLGPRRRNRKPVLQLLRPDGRTVGFAKVGWSPFTAALVGNEAGWLRHVDGRMPPGTAAPAVLVDLLVDDARVVVTSPVRTPVFAKRRGPLPSDTLRRIARLGTTETSTVADLVMLGDFESHGLGEVVPLDALVERHRSVELELGLWHGDLTPWNTATSGGITSIWDWEFAGDHRPVGFDALHIAFEIVRRSGAPAGGSSENRAIETVERDAAAILDSVTGPEATAAITDLYLCELLHRERRLLGEGWTPTHVGPLEPLLVAALTRRLG